MEIEDIVPVCVSSTMQALSMMAATEVEVGDPCRTDFRGTWGDVTGMLGLVGKNCKGNFSLSFEESTILRIVSNMLMEEFTTVDDDVIDAVGELTNMISGSVKKSLLDGGADIDMASPMVLVGKHIPVTQFTGAPTYQIPFATSHGAFVVEITFKQD